MGLSEYATELRDRNLQIAPKSPGSVLDLYGPFWLLILWAYERFPPVAPRVTLEAEEMRNRSRAEKYADLTPPTLSTGECFKILIVEEILKWRPYREKVFFWDKDENEIIYLPSGHITRKCFWFLRMLTPSHIF